MLPLRQLVVTTPQPVAKRIRNPLIRVLTDRMMKRMGTTSYRAIYARTSLFNEESSGTPYTLMIRNFGSKKDPNNFDFLPDSQLWVHCSCPYFTYYLEVVLKLYGASDIYDSNGRLPRVRNYPAMRPYLCKHQLATVLNLVVKDKNKAKTKAPPPPESTKKKPSTSTRPEREGTTPKAPTAPTAPKAPGRGEGEE
jgi:hypothetical protein